jgi:formate dehydrogenase iron-sulfur subunit
MIADGNARVKMLKDQGYEEANLYGVDQFGGLRVLLVLQYGPDYYSLPVNPEVPIGTSIWQYLLKPLGGIAAIGMIGGLIYNYTSNKRELAKKDSA